MNVCFRHAGIGIVMVGLAMVEPASRAADHPKAPTPQTAGTLSAHAIIQKMAAHYSKLSSLQVSIDGSITLTMNGKKLKLSEPETLVLQRPDLYDYRVHIPSYSDIKSPGKLMNYILSDGLRIVDYNGFLKQYTSAPAISLAALAAQNAVQKDSRWAPASMLLITLLTDSPTGQATDRFMGAVRDVGRKTLNGTSVALLGYSLSGYDRSKGLKAFLAVDASSGRIVQATMIIPDATMTETVHTLSENQPLPASLFTFHPPADAKLVDKFQTPSSGGADDTAAKTASQMVGKPAPDFSLQDVNGKTVDLNSLKGRTILMDFSASW